MPKPCLGYRSRTAAAVALAAQGLGSGEIADRIEAASGETVTAKMVDDLLASRERGRLRLRDNLHRYAEHFRAAAGVDRRGVARFLRDLAAEIDAGENAR